VVKPGIDKEIGVKCLSHLVIAGLLGEASKCWFIVGFWPERRLRNTKIEFMRERISSLGY